MKPPRKNGIKPAKPRLRKKGLANDHHVIILMRDGRRKAIAVSVLMLETFVSPRPNGMLACHGKKGSLVDTLDNLYWSTPSQNNGRDEIRDGTDSRGEKHGRHILNELQVRIVRRAYELSGKEIMPKHNPRQRQYHYLISQHYLARIFHVDRSTIASVIHRINWKHI